jgi:hypothetical protein
MAMIGMRNIVPRLYLVTTLLFIGGLAFADSPVEAVIPDTPAGRTLGLWLDSFNSGDSARIDSFDRMHAPWLTLDRAMAARARSGGYDLLRVDKSERLWLIFHARQKADESAIRGSIVVKPDAPAVISLLSLGPAAAISREFTVDGAERDSLIEGAGNLLEKFYVFPDVGKRMSAALRRLQKRGEYRAITDGDIFAARLSDDLRAVGKDKHVSVHFSAETVPADQPDGPTQHLKIDPMRARHLTTSNCGFEVAEHLLPNIGYLKLDEFAEPEICAQTAIAAMNFFADSAVLAIDLRDNRGGRAEMVALLASYLFDAPRHLDDIVDRQKGTTEQTWTFPYVPGKRFTDKPVFILTSRRTFSAAEEFSYDLKNLGRVTLIGESTGGGAHTVGPHRLDDHFYIEVPFGRIVNPITKTDWEGTGVEPDVKVRAEDALTEVLRRARSQ